MQVETESLTEKINKGLIESHKASHPTKAQQWSVLKMHFQKHASTLSYKEKLIIEHKAREFVNKFIWYVPSLRRAQDECVNPWLRVVVPEWNQTKEGRACIAFAKRGRVIGKNVQNAICPVCEKPFVQNDEPEYLMYSMGNFVYSCELLHYMEEHSVRPWDLDFIEAAVKWSKFPVSVLNWKTIMLKRYVNRMGMNVLGIGTLAL